MKICEKRRMWKNNRFSQNFHKKPSSLNVVSLLIITHIPRSLRVKIRKLWSLISSKKNIRIAFKVKIWSEKLKQLEKREHNISKNKFIFEENWKKNSLPSFFISTLFLFRILLFFSWNLFLYFIVFLGSENFWKSEKVFQKFLAANSLCFPIELIKMKSFSGNSH